VYANAYIFLLVIFKFKNIKTKKLCRMITYTHHFIKKILNMINNIEKTLLDLAAFLMEIFVSIYTSSPSVRILLTDSWTETVH
jgi:hypothetical protein